jgi:hypothetical protein
MPIPRNAARAAAAILLSLLLLSWGPAPRCLAADAVTVDVGSVYASSEGSSVDPGLANIRGKLRAMFDYTNYRMLERKRRTLAVGETGDIALPGAVHEHQAAAGRRRQGPASPSISARAARACLSTTLGLSRGGMVLVGGPSHEAGVLSSSFRRLISITAVRPSPSLWNNPPAPFVGTGADT